MKMLKKIFTLVVLVFLVCSVGMMEVKADTGSITIEETINGKIYELYRIFDLTYVQETYTDNDVKKTILTCVDADNPVFRLTIINDSIKMDQCAYLTGTALRGWHPNTNIDNAPWERCYKIGELPSFSDIFNSKVEYDFDSVIIPRIRP